MALPPPTLLIPQILSWLDEDWGRGDRALGGTTSVATAQIWVKQPGVIAGLPVIAQIWQEIERLYQQSLDFEPLVSEGHRCCERTLVATVRGQAALLLLGERVCLNILAHLSGIASQTRRYVDCIADLPAQLVDTRKTRPGLRLLEKYAVTVGGGQNHRAGLDDLIMLKDNHIAIAKGVKEAVQQSRSQQSLSTLIEVETETLAQVEAALAANVNIIMLDNMDLDTMQKALTLINGRAKVEASGNITLERLRDIALLGVDYISTSATITQATWLDVGMDIEV